MGLMRREFEAWRRLRTFSPSQKLPPVAPWWGGEGGGAPDSKHALLGAPTAWDAVESGWRSEAPQGEVSVTRTGSLHGGWGGRAPSYLHRRG